MRSFTHQLIAAALTSVLALSGIPAAFAFSLNADLHALTNAHHDDASVESDASASAHADADARGFARCKSFSGSDLIRCKTLIQERAEAKGEAKADVETHGSFVSTMHKDEEHAKATVADIEARVLSMLKRSFNAAAKLVRRVCSDNNSDATLVSQCVATAKSHIQAQVTAMIDAAFSVN